MGAEIALLGGVFLLVLAVIAGAGYWYLQQQEEQGVEATPREMLADTLHRVGGALPTRHSQAERYSRLLRQAGYRRPEALTIFFGLKAAATVILGLGLAVTAVLAGQGFAWISALAAGMGIGYLAPDRVLMHLIARRSERLKRSLPLALELMVLGLEGGQSLDAAMLETAQELQSSHPEIAEELASVPLQVLSTRSRQEALRELMDQNPEPEVRRFAQVLIDSDRFGTALAGALRNQLRYLRTHLRQSAQEQARKVSVKLVFPVFFLIFPAVLLVTLGPAVLQLMGTLGQQFDSLK